MDLIPQDPNFDPTGFWASDIYDRLVRLGNAIWPATQYGNRYVVDDAKSQALLKLGLAGYYQSLVPCIQLEEALYFLRALNIEYPYCVTVRAYIEHVARAHKAAKIGKQWALDQDEAALVEGARRIIAAHKVNQAEGYNVLTLVRGVRDVIPDVEAHYDDLSAYNHGDFTWHALLRKQSFFVNQKKMLSPAITQWDELLNALRTTLGQDIEWTTALLGPFIRRMGPKLEDAGKDQTEDG